ncbi:hypothetical protein QTV43_000068 [Vibrio vulnificus]|nr:hypothetical protein [Vibrio vulnificus]
MTISNKRQAFSKIRNLLPENDAAAFMECQQYLSLLSLEGYAKVATERLTDILNGDFKQVERFIDIHNSLCDLYLQLTERVNSHKSVTGEKSLWNLLTDGESHLKIYPSVKFS